MEKIGKCQECIFFKDLVTVPNGHPGITKRMINCLKFGYLELLIDPETCCLFKTNRP